FDKVSKIDDLWIDIGATSKGQVLERVRVGDAGVLDAASLDLPNGRIVSRSIDNRIGAYVVAEALRLLSKTKPKAAVFAVAAARDRHRRRRHLQRAARHSHRPRLGAEPLHAQPERDGDAGGSGADRAVARGVRAAADAGDQLRAVGGS